MYNAYQILIDKKLFFCQYWILYIIGISQSSCLSSCYFYHNEVARWKDKFEWKKILNCSFLYTVDDTEASTANT